MGTKELSNRAQTNNKIANILIEQADLCVSLSDQSYSPSCHNQSHKWYASALRCECLSILFYLLVLIFLCSISLFTFPL